MLLINRPHNDISIATMFFRRKKNRGNKSYNKTLRYKGEPKKCLSKQEINLTLTNTENITKTEHYWNKNENGILKLQILYTVSQLR